MSDVIFWTLMCSLLAFALVYLSWKFVHGVTRGVDGLPPLSEYWTSKGGRR